MSVGTLLASPLAQSWRTVAGPTDNRPESVLTPVMMALMVPAESAVCELTL